MAATPKVKPQPAAPPPPSRREDRTSTVVWATLIALTGLGVVTVFWDPLAALANGASTAGSVGEPRSAVPDAGVNTTVASPANAPATAVDASGSS